MCRDPGKMIDWASGFDDAARGYAESGSNSRKQGSNHVTTIG